MTTLDEHQVAEFLGCSVALLRRMRREGRGPKFTRIGRLVRYREDWLSQCIEANSVDAQARKEARSGDLNIEEILRPAEAKLRVCLRKKTSP